MSDRMMGQAHRYRQVADRFEAAAQANLARGVGIAELCRIAGVERRTLVRAFRAVHGETPSRYLRMLRLNLARQALLAADAGCKTVTEILTGFGVRELGRFAERYRMTFGETPSQTKRHAGRACTDCINGPPAP
jgi:transcriptional regulator GlxA family with amidase domain